MRKVMMIVSLTLLACFYFYINRQEADIIDVHYDGYSAEVLVDRLPFPTRQKLPGGKRIKMISDINIIFLAVKQARC